MALIAIEGIDGSGKATLSKYLQAAISQSRGPDDEIYTAEVIAFPDYSTPVGSVIMDQLQTGRAASKPLEHQALHAANKYERLEQLLGRTHCGHTVREIFRDGVLEKTLLVSEHVILDRYYGASLAYGAATGLDMEWLASLNMGLPEPEIWIYLDIPAEESFARRPYRRDGYERDRNLIQSARAAYFEAIDSGYMSPCVVIDADADFDTIAEQAWDVVVDYLGIEAPRPDSHSIIGPVGKPHLKVV